MKKIIISALLLVGSLSYARNYGAAGCGLGSVVVGGKDNQIIAATLNATGYQTSGITSGTSNCTDHGAVKKSAQVTMFLEVNKSSLAKDVARGEGETLAGLANILGCSSDNLGTALKKNYQSIFVDSKMQPQVMESGISNVVNSNRTTCGA